MLRYVICCNRCNILWECAVKEHMFQINRMGSYCVCNIAFPWRINCYERNEQCSSFSPVKTERRGVLLVEKPAPKNTRYNTKGLL